jgi:hypothetical protein
VYFQIGWQRPSSLIFQLSVLCQTKICCFTQHAGNAPLRLEWTKPSSVTLTNQVGILDAAFTRGGGM